MGKVVLTGSGSWQPPEGLAEIEQVIIVGGGGGGGASGVDDWPGGGGGGGGVVVLENYAITPNEAIAYSVGGGGLGSSDRTLSGENGEDTVFAGITALGGGGGGSGGSITGIDGGSGGGAVRTSGGGAGLQPTSADGGLGNNGGSGTLDPPGYGSGGGGGADSAGLTATGAAAGDGGDAHTIDGEHYGGGGGGGTYDTENEGQGGANAGSGGKSGDEDGEDGIDGFGGGGGGAGSSPASGGTGGSGGSGTIVLIDTNIEAEAPPEFDDWAANIDPITSRTYYALEVSGAGLPPLRIPISSWQATVQSGRASFAQAVIPNALPWVAAIELREDGEFAIYRGVRFSDGSTNESELARAPLQTVRLDRGPNRASMTISGYATLPPSTQEVTRVLQNVRSVSTGTGIRVRCDIDFFLRPGHTAIAMGAPFEVAYINYYANAQDEYMDVGDRAL